MLSLDRNYKTRNNELSSTHRRTKISRLKESVTSLVCCKGSEKRQDTGTCSENTKMSTTTVDNENNRSRQFFCGVVEGFYGRPWTTEQRKELFRRMNKMGLNTYLYAPKDDSKHRSFWRELYSVEEADHLTSLIESATECNVSFVYALSPGLDMTFSSAKEVTYLKKKLEQVSTFGCKAFSLLFDDIEPELCEADKQVYQSFAHAQVSVTNEVYQHLNEPRFLFCPTEYCASRAVPNVAKSEYLTTIGAKLLPDIDIMWTGPKVISKKISIQSIDELATVLKRPPVIWDNIHANDYDQKRLFLGPYHGRTTDLIPYLNGVLTNPNCEFEANYVALHTLAQWSKCNKGVKKDHISNEKSPVVADIKLEQEGELGTTDEDIPTLDGYCHKAALKAAITDWMSEMYRRIDFASATKINTPTASAPTDLPIVQTPVNTCMTITPTTTSVASATSLNTIPFTGITNANQLERLDEDGSDSYMQPVTKEIVNSLVDVATSLQCNNTTLVPTPEPMDAEPGSSFPVIHVDTKDADVMQVDSATDSTSEIPEADRMSEEDMMLLVDLFYLPFEHGSEAVKLLNDFHWLKTNSHSLVNILSPKKPVAETSEWHEKATEFGASVKRVSDLCDKLLKIPNRAILYDLYPYIWDLRGVLGLLNSFVKWLACGNLPERNQVLLSGTISWASKGYKDAFLGGDQEPWVFRGGLTGEFQRMLPIDGAYDLFNIKVPETPIFKVLTIRPYLPSDESAVYDVCLKTCDDGLDGSAIFAGQPDVISDKLVGGFLTVSPEYCFVLEDDDGICGYVLAAPDAKIYYEKLETAWLPAMCAKYEKPANEDGLTPAEEVMVTFHSHKTFLPDKLHTRFPSILTMSIIASRVDDPAVPKRLLACVFSALKAHGTHGAYTEIQVGEKNTLEFYMRLGFLDVPALDVTPEDIMVLGRIL